MCVCFAKSEISYLEVKVGELDFGSHFLSGEKGSMACSVWSRWWMVGWWLGGWVLSVVNWFDNESGDNFLWLNIWFYWVQARALSLFPSRSSPHFANPWQHLVTDLYFGTTWCMQYGYTPMQYATADSALIHLICMINLSANQLWYGRVWHISTSI